MSDPAGFEFKATEFKNDDEDDDDDKASE